MTTVAAPVLEIFPSVQGEGLLVGAPQVFVRLGRCQIVCNYCDTPESIGDPPARMEHVPALGAEPEFHDNPLSCEQVEAMILATTARHPAIRTVAVTGGEPLLHTDFLAELLPRLRARGLRILLETNGLLTAAMHRLAADVDIASIDIKLPAETGLEPGTLVRKHTAFLEACRPCPVRVCKVVVTKETTLEDLDAARALIAAENPSLPTYLTPVTPYADGPRPPSLEGLLTMAAHLGEELEEVRILPQLHTLAGWR